MFSFDSLGNSFVNGLKAAEEEVFGALRKNTVKNEEERNHQRRLLDLCLRAELKLHRIDGPQHHVCKQEEVEVPADQQLQNQEGKFSVDQEEPEVLHLKEEPEVLHLKEEPELLHLKESVDNLPVISSVVGAANIDLLISNSSHVSVSHEGRGETSRKDAEIESQFQSQRTSNTTHSLLAV
ncbi:uncharacterized protein [Antennarius striatus]|uniref:uncharacterized protein isoform X3 n=1 Tax=Antennarius striatus TaxID=241820 RepID=UPI0035AD99BB